jgi:hypothetical protein
MIKLAKLGIEGIYLKIIKAMYDKPIANIVLNKIIASKYRNETRLSTLSNLTQHSLGIPSYSNKTGRRNERNMNRKGRSQISLFLGDIILYLKVEKYSIKKLLDTINSFSKVT